VYVALHYSMQSIRMTSILALPVRPTSIVPTRLPTPVSVTVDNHTIYSGSSPKSFMGGQPCPVPATQRFVSLHPKHSQIIPPYAAVCGCICKTQSDRRGFFPWMTAICAVDLRTFFVRRNLDLPFFARVKGRSLSMENAGRIECRWIHVA